MISKSANVVPTNWSEDNARKSYKRLHRKFDLGKLKKKTMNKVRRYKEGKI